MLHPVGPHRSAVYWRRRLLLLVLLLAVLVGGGWLAVAAGSGGQDSSSTAAATASRSGEPAAPPALERVVPSLASVQTPTPPSTPTPAPAPAPTTPAPSPGGPCSDDMVNLEVRAPANARAEDRPTFELVVTNTTPVPCVRVLDEGLQEIVMLDGAGNRVWGSNDCFPEASSDTRTLAPGESVSFPLVWSGLTSEPTCGAARTAPPPGQYVLRGRLDTKTSADTPFTVV
ncbi:MucR family transcriptional regulator [Geodermatophilus sp. TF02-6]|uniref:MucR family transcriptional regulator n=1 Tax=Geodermatophilus sp. TF02-6 TaxID=2250575 RepID=UPI000DEBE729|nr:MucR family transcriptional regulator [Geodermatophilus sp. TF02-6]RBY76793.1 MucR family transcriptional regulator [Geodermatophilus sp. TF02-6]